LQRSRRKLPEVDLLKIDKDCHVDARLEEEYVQDSIGILAKHGIRVEWIKSARTPHGRHYYIKIDPAVEAQIANRLQYLIGDDAKRVDFNQARIDSGLRHWNILFETIGRKLRTIYSNPASQPTRKSRAKRTSQPDPS
jgi:hypothetical protein